MNMNLTKEWFEKMTALEGELEIGAGVPDYLPGFIPSDADKHYGALVEKLTRDNALLVKALKEIACLEDPAPLDWWQKKAREALSTAGR